MYEEINRFLSHPDQPDNFDTFFGTPHWREGVDLAGPKARNRFLHDLYLRQLRDVAKVRYVRSFEMRNMRNRVGYYLFHGTNNIRGLERMKDAMWKVDQTGAFSFSDSTDPNQAVLLGNAPRFDLLRRQLLERFAGHEPSVREIEEFVLADTAFRSAHYKRVLRQLETDDPPVISAIDPPPG